MGPWSKRFLTVHGLILVLLLGLFGWVFTDLAWDLHKGMRTHKADLGQVAQAVWNSGQGRFVAMTDNGPLSSRLTDHVEPILATISPVLWLWRDVKTLLLLQVMAAVIGGWLLYQIACEHFKTLLSPHEQNQIWRLEPLYNLTKPIALAIVFAFLLSPQIQNALLTEFHAAPLAVPLILWSFHAVEKLAIPNQSSKTRYWIEFTFATILTALVKEEMALLAAGLGIWAMYRLGIRDLILRSGVRLRGLFHSPTADSHSIGNRHVASQSTDSDRTAASHHGRATTEYRLSTSIYLLPLVLTILCIVWFYIATFVIVPAHAVEVYESAENPYWARYGALGNSPLDIIKSLILQPDVVFLIISEPIRTQYLWGLAATFGFFCLLAPEILLLSLPLLLANVLSAYPPQYYGEFHYSAPVVAYFGVSSVYGIGRLGRLIMRTTSGASPSFQHLPAAASWAMTLTTLASNSRTTIRPLLFAGVALWIAGWGIRGYLAEGRGPLGGRVDSVEVNAHHRRLDQFVEQVPWDAAVTATAAVHPHVALRTHVYQFPIGMPEFGEQGDAEWALLDVTTNTDMAPGDLYALVQRMLAADWGVIDGADGFLLMRQGAGNKEIPSAFYDFARIDARPASAGDSNDEDGALTLVDVVVDDWPRWRSTKVITTWEVGQGFELGRDEPKFAIYTPAGELLYSYSDGKPTALIWYPPELWQPGDRIRVTTPALTLPRVWGVAVGAAAVSARALEISDGSVTLVASYARNAYNELIPIPLPETQESANLPLPALEAAISLNDETTTMFRIDPRITEPGQQKMQSYTSKEIGPTGTVNLLMQWAFEEQGNTLWNQWTPFVHVRNHENSNVAQQDGAPRWFLYYNPASWITEGMPLWDWRQMTIPADTPVVNPTLNLVVGLYDPANGERAPIWDSDGRSNENEAAVGVLHLVERSAPDFACSMSPGSCQSQPGPR